MIHDDISGAEIEAVRQFFIIRASCRFACKAESPDCECAKDARAAILASRAALLAEGRKVVAREPTDNMDMTAWQFEHGEHGTGLFNWRNAWRAMWDAAP